MVDLGAEALRKQRDTVQLNTKAESTHAAPTNSKTHITAAPMPNFNKRNVGYYLILNQVKGPHTRGKESDPSEAKTTDHV